METVASSNEIAGQFVSLIVLSISDFRLGALEVMQADVFNLEQDLASSSDVGIG